MHQAAGEPSLARRPVVPNVLGDDEPDVRRRLATLRVALDEVATAPGLTRAEPARARKAGRVGGAPAGAPPVSSGVAGAGSQCTMVPVAARRAWARASAASALTSSPG